MGLPPALPLLDTHRRPLGSLRISITDRCNLRCGYCMPEENYLWLPRAEVLTFEEIAFLAGAFLRLGVDRLRLTGGEPTLRRELPRLVRGLARLEGLRDLALTTNGLRLEGLAEPLRRAGLTRITISLDTLRRERYRDLTRHDGLDDALAGLAAARSTGFGPVKLNTVVMRGRNDDEVGELLDFARAGGHELRFIEYMDVGGATNWEASAVVPREEILERVEAAHGTVRALPGRGAAPAERFALSDGTVFGVIASTTAPFCGACDRARLTADGRFFTCLYAREGLDLRGPLRAGATQEELAARVADAWSGRRDRGAEERLGLVGRTRLADAEQMRSEPHLEMHKRGG